MASNYLLMLFPLIIVGTFVPALQLLALVVIIAFAAEWYVIGRRIKALATKRNGSAKGSAFGIGFYAGSRAYLPRRFRLPRPQVKIGDPI